ncbi:CMTM8 [Branchiostoma lanceolatum]|uniref:CMTM8 protein n=1 Tax=Branchiostoma lanceolatum TaxID=7740 RepID=A0A8J9ZAN6_BRALA|nr:CMTM8 [Branchiostoma lanceolatum]
MADPGFPDSHTTTATTTTTTTTTTPSSPFCDIGYFLTLPGILKILQLFFGLITWACVASYPYRYYSLGGGQHWVMFVAVTCWIVTLLLVIFYSTSLYKRIALPWLFLELVYGAAATLLYLIAFAVQAGTTHTRYQFANSNWYNTYAAAAAFALFTTICYAVDAFLAFRNWQSGGTNTGGNTANA